MMATADPIIPSVVICDEVSCTLDAKEEGAWGKEWEKATVMVSRNEKGTIGGNCISLMGTHLCFENNA